MERAIAKLRQHYHDSSCMLCCFCCCDHHSYATTTIIIDHTNSLSPSRPAKKIQHTIQHTTTPCLKCQEQQQQEQLLGNLTIIGTMGKSVNDLPLSSSTSSTSSLEPSAAPLTLSSYVNPESLEVLLLDYFQFTFSHVLVLICLIYLGLQMC